MVSGFDFKNAENSNSKYPFNPIIFFVDLVILNAMSNWNMSFKSIFICQEINKIFDVNVKNFVDLLTNKY